jgi:hypothetical protein
MSIVRTTQQARGLQRCSTSPCVVCGLDSRLSVVVDRWDEWVTTHDGHMVLSGERQGPFYNLRVCAKHKHFTGTAVCERGWEDAPQVTRYFISTPAQRAATQP